mmetsp:Transcript_19203/g.41606  ORF Transcript_19203/g.41606 Transcript_19203/m.41606 type:complete len:404 (-) Transcript_19203:106-1317(-)
MTSLPPVVRLAALLRSIIVYIPGHGLGTGIHADASGPIARIAIPAGAAVLHSGGTLGGRAGKVGEAFTRLLIPIRSLAAGEHGGEVGTIRLVFEGEGHVVAAGGFGPGRVVVGVEEVGAAGAGGAHGGRAGEFGDAGAGHLSSVGSLAAGEHGGVGGTIGFAGVWEGGGIAAAGLGPGRVVIGVEKVENTARVRGGGCWRGWKICEAFSAHLSSIGTLATRQHGRILGTPAGLRIRRLINTRSLRPRRIVIGIIKRQSPPDRNETRGSGTRRRRTLQVLETSARRPLSAVRSLAAREVGREAGTLVATARAGELAFAVGPVSNLGIPLFVALRCLKIATGSFVGGGLEVLEEGGEGGVAFDDGCGFGRGDRGGGGLDVALSGELVDELAEADGVGGRDGEDGE